jgi:hypothetical protein
MHRQLSKLLVARGMVAAESMAGAIEHRLASHVALDSALLDLGLVGEGPLRQAMAEAAGLAAATDEDLRAAGESLESPLLSKEDALAKDVCPVRRTADDVFLLTAAPPAPSVQDAIAQQIAAKVRLLIAPELRVREAQSRRYGFPLPAFFQALGEKVGWLGGEPPGGNSSSGPAPSTTDEAPAPEKAVAAANAAFVDAAVRTHADRDARPGRADHEESATVAVPAVPHDDDFDAEPSVVVAAELIESAHADANGDRVRGAVAALASYLESAQTPAQVLEAFERWVESRFAHGRVYFVQGEVVTPWGARYPRIALAEAPLLGEVAASGQSYRGPIPPGHGALVATLGRPPPVEVALRPIQTKGLRCIAWGDDGRHPLADAAVRELAEAAPVVEAALARVREGVA